MPSPFYNLIKGTTAGAAGTGAFTPNAASTGFRAWSKAPVGVYPVRYDDWANWELSFSYWNATTLSRAATQLYDSSSGSAISLTSAATAALVIGAQDVGPALGETSWGCSNIVPNSTFATLAMAGAILGTSAGVTPANTNLLTEMVARQSTSATTVNAQAGCNCGTTVMAFASSSAGRGGWEFTFSFGASTLPTGPRAFIGMTDTTFVASTAEPSALAGKFAVLGKDSTDTNFQLLTRDGTTANKIDTGIAWAANGAYRVKLWSDPGSLTVNLLLIRNDTGAVYFGSTATNAPLTGTGLYPQMIGSLNGTNTGTAVTMAVGQFALYRGG